MSEFTQVAPASARSVIFDRVLTAYPGRVIERRIRHYDAAGAAQAAAGTEAGYYIEAHPFAIDRVTGQKTFVEGWYWGSKMLLEQSLSCSAEGLGRLAKARETRPAADVVLREAIARNGIIMPEPVRDRSLELDPMPVADLRFSDPVTPSTV